MTDKELFYEFTPERNLGSLVLPEKIRNQIQELVEEQHRAELLYAHNLRAIRMARRESVKRIRVRIMQEAYDLADRDDSEGYNSVKVMCSDVLGMINELLDERQWQGLTDEEKADTVSGLAIANNIEREWRDRMNAALKTEREKVAQWMISRGYATGHGDTIEDLLQELEWQIAEN